MTTKEIKVSNTTFYLTKEELIDLEDQCEDALLELRLESLVSNVKRFGQSKTLTDFFRGGK